MTMTIVDDESDDDSEDDDDADAPLSACVVGNSVGSAVGLVLGERVWWLQAPGKVSYNDSISWSSVRNPVLQVRV